MAVSAGQLPLMSTDAVDLALARRSADADRIAGAIVDLESHPGHQFLSGARLTGRSAAKWTDTKGDIALLYHRFDAYRSILASATEVRSRRSKPGQNELGELTAQIGRAHV